MRYLEFIIKMQSIAKIGLKFSKDPYAIENYETIQKLSKEMLENFSDEKIERDNYFERDIYPTPNVSVRVLVEQDNKFLFVKEIVEQKYTLPGGWCEVFETAKENAVSEVLQESGYEVELDRVLAIFNRGLDVTTVSEYLIVFSGKITGGFKRLSHETDDVTFFDQHELPILSHKMSKNELEIIFDVFNNDKETYFD